MLLFEWNEAKRASNLIKHGVRFEVAQRIFDGWVLTQADDRRDYGERREVSIGVVEDELFLTVVHTSRAGRIRIISARLASQSERSRYEEAL